MSSPPLMARMALVLLASLTVMSGATLAPALPTMASHFTPDGGAETNLWVRLVLTGPALTIACCAWGVGMILDRVGRLRPLWGALVLYALAGSAGLWLDSLGGLVISRLALGLAVAVIMTASTALVGDLFQGRGREHFLSRQAAFMGYGGVVFLMLGGLLAVVGWRAPFTVYLLSLPVMVLAWVVLRPVVHDRVNAQSLAAKTDEPDPKVQGWQAWVPGILHLFAAITFIGFYQVPSQVPFLILSLDPEAASWLIGGLVASLNLVAASVAMVYGAVRSHCRYPTIMALGFGCLAAGLAVIALAPGLFSVWVGTALCGVGLGLAMPNMSVWLLSVVPHKSRGRSVGAQTAGVFLGQFLAPLLTQPLVAAMGVPAAFVGAAILVMAAALFCVVVPLDRASLDGTTVERL